MAYFALLWKARAIEKYRLNYEQEKLNSIRLTNLETPRLSLIQKLRHYRYDTRKRAGKLFQKCCPEGSSLGTFFLYLKTDQTFPNFVWKSILGFVGGIILTYLCFIFFVFQLAISLVHATIMSSIIGVLLTLGLAFSYRIRCLVFLLIPQFFSRVGRYTLTCYALVLILTGPATNTLRNSEVLSESMACGQEQVKTSVRQITESIKKPFNSMKDTIKSMIEKVKQVAVKFKETLLTVHRLIMSIVRVLESAFSWLSSIVSICNKKLGTPYVRCTTALSDGVLDCRAKLGPYFSWLCNVTYVANAACLAVKPLDFICILVEFVSGSIVATIKRKLKTFSNHIKTMLYVSVHVHHSYYFSSNSSKSASQVAAGIVTEIRHRADPLLTWLSWSSCVTSLFLLLIIFRAKYYQHMYDTRSRYDNRYVTKELRILDLKRVRENRDTILPLNRRERAKYINTTSFRLVATERLYLTRSIVFMCITTFKLLIHIVADYSLYWVLMTIRHHGRFQSPQLPGVPDAGVQVSGQGPVAGMLRSLVGSLTLPLATPAPSSVPCLPNPYPPDLQRYTQIGVLIFLLWFFALFEPYGLRLRHVIMGHYRPARAKARAIWLYNHILRTRGGFLKLARRKLHRDYKYSSEEKFTFRQWLDANIPCWWLRMLLRTAPNEPHCLLCGTFEKPNDPDTQLIKCETPNCPGIYCTSCFADVGQLCTICLSPVDYGDVSDVSLEKGSSEDSSTDHEDLELTKSADEETSLLETSHTKSETDDTTPPSSDDTKEDNSSNKKDSEQSDTTDSELSDKSKDNSKELNTSDDQEQNTKAVNYCFKESNSGSKKIYCRGYNNKILSKSISNFKFRKRKKMHNFIENMFKLLHLKTSNKNYLSLKTLKSKRTRMYRKSSRYRKHHILKNIARCISNNDFERLNNIVQNIENEKMRCTDSIQVYLSQDYKLENNTKEKDTKAIGRKKHRKLSLKNEKNHFKLLELIHNDDDYDPDDRQYMTQDEWIREQYDKEVGLEEVNKAKKDALLQAAIKELKDARGKLKKNKYVTINFKGKPLKESKARNLHWHSAPKPIRCACPATHCYCVGKYLQSPGQRLPKFKNRYRGIVKYILTYVWKRKNVPPPNGTFIDEFEATINEEIKAYNQWNEERILESRGPEDCLNRCPHFYRSEKSSKKGFKFFKLGAEKNQEINEDEKATEHKINDILEPIKTVTSYTVDEPLIPNNIDEELTVSESNKIKHPEELYKDCIKDCPCLRPCQKKRRRRKEDHSTKPKSDDNGKLITKKHTAINENNKKIIKEQEKQNKTEEIVQGKQNKIKDIIQRKHNNAQTGVVKETEKYETKIKIEKKHAGVSQNELKAKSNNTKTQKAISETKDKFNELKANNNNKQAPNIKLVNGDKVNKIKATNNKTNTPESKLEIEDKFNNLKAANNYTKDPNRKLKIEDEIKSYESKIIIKNNELNDHDSCDRLIEELKKEIKKKTLIPKRKIDEASFQDLVEDKPLSDGVSLASSTQSNISSEENENNTIVDIDSLNFDSKIKQGEADNKIMDASNLSSGICSIGRKLHCLCDWLFGVDTGYEKEVEAKPIYHTRSSQWTDPIDAETISTEQIEEKKSSLDVQETKTPLRYGRCCPCKGTSEDHSNRVQQKSPTSKMKCSQRKKHTKNNEIIRPGLELYNSPDKDPEKLAGSKKITGMMLEIKSEAMNKECGLKLDYISEKAGLKFKHDTVKNGYFESNNNSYNDESGTSLTRSSDWWSPLFERKANNPCVLNFKQKTNREFNNNKSIVDYFPLVTNSSSNDKKVRFKKEYCMKY